MTLFSAPTLCLSFPFIPPFVPRLRPLSSCFPLRLFQPSLPTLMQIWAWTDGREQKVFTRTQLGTKRADACRAAAHSPPLPTSHHDTETGLTGGRGEGTEPPPSRSPTPLHTHRRWQSCLHLVSVASSPGSVCRPHFLLPPPWDIVACLSVSGAHRHKHFSCLRLMSQGFSKPKLNPEFISRVKHLWNPSLKICSFSFLDTSSHSLAF